MAVETTGFGLEPLFTDLFAVLSPRQDLHHFCMWNPGADPKLANLTVRFGWHDPVIPREREECICTGCTLWREDPAEAQRWTDRLHEWQAASARALRMEKPWHERYINWMHAAWADANDRWDDHGTW